MGGAGCPRIGPTHNGGWSRENPADILPQGSRSAMSVLARCEGCDKQYRLDDKFAGRKVRCKACGGVIAVPAATGHAPAAPVRRSAVAASAARPSAARPAAGATVRSAPVRTKPAPPPVDDENPFDNIDALMS